MNGNDRFVAARQQYSHQSAVHCQLLHDGQKPFALLYKLCRLACVARAYFYQGLVGNLFIVRVAGHVVDKVVFASIEFAVEICFLNSPLSDLR